MMGLYRVLEHQPSLILLIISFNFLHILTSFGLLGSLSRSVFYVDRGSLAVSALT